MDASFAARELVEPLRMPYEQALIELAHAQLLRREGKRRAASELLLGARGRLRRARRRSGPAPVRPGADAPAA